MRYDRQRIMDMLEAIGNIERFVSEDHAKSPDQELLNVWVIHHIQIIGEAASKLSNAFRAANPEVAWGGMIGMRQVLVHGYFATDSKLVWKVVQNDLPVLKSQLESILKKIT